MTDLDLKRYEIATTHEDIIRGNAEVVLERMIPWDGYMKANLIMERELDLIRKYDKKSADARATLIQKEGDTYAALFLELVNKINKEETIHYLLAVIDNLLTENPDASALFLKLATKNPVLPFDPFLRILARNNCDWFMSAKASSILATLMSNTSVSPDHVKFICNWLRVNLAKAEEKEVNNAIVVLPRFLRNDAFRLPFAEDGGVRQLALLKKQKMKNFQLLYQLTTALWLLSYNKEVAADKFKDTKAIQTSVEVLRTVTKEKVLRMELATLRNLLNVGDNNEEMIDADVMKPLENLTNRNWGDEDMKADLEALNDTLQQHVVVLSTFDMYKKEILSGHLEWSPVHRSEKFWRENVSRLEEDSNRILLYLKGLLTESTNPTVQSIACYDLGEFARIHPRGKILLQKLGIKLPLMALMDARDEQVKKQALTAVQKLLVTNWEYLAK